MSRWPRLDQVFPDSKEIALAGIGDLHAGSSAFMEGAFKKWVRECKDNGYLVILMGDLCEMAIRASPSDVYDQTMSPDEQIAYVIDELTPIKDQILGGINGNHGAGRLIKSVGVNPDGWICNQLGVPHFGPVCYGRLKVGAANWKIMAAHGTGGGSLLGSKLNVASEKMTKICPNADLYMCGHTHANVYGSSDIIDISVASRGVVTNTATRHYSGTGSLHAYGGYPEDKLLPPSTPMQVVHFLGDRIHVSDGNGDAYHKPFRREVRIFKRG